MNIQPIVFNVPSAPTQAVTPSQPKFASSGVLPWVAVAVLALLLVWSQFVKTSDVTPGPGPTPVPVVVIEEAASGAHATHKKEAANYALAHRRLADLVRNKTITNQSQFASNSEALMKSARDNAWPVHLGPLDNKYLPEKFEGRESDVANYLESLAAGFERAAK